MADSLGVTMATGLMAEVWAGDRSRAKRTAAEPVELEAKPTDSVSRERGSQHWFTGYKKIFKRFNLLFII